LNPLATVRWNTDKHYLAELSRAGVPVVPSLFVEPDDNVENALDGFLATYPEADDFVIKPCVGAGSRDAQRHRRETWEQARAHLRRLLDARRSALLQPYFHSVDEYGETALLFFEGEYSHAIRKGPLLKRGESSTSELFAAEQITPRTPSDQEIAIARDALAAMPFANPLLYARVDLINDDTGSPRVLELELTEPSVFLAHARGAAERFVQAIMRRVPA
jgi:O-ureido-D-serine cyclo-ligase